MKKTLFLGFLIVLLACDDGDIQIDRLDFESVNVMSCANVSDPIETTFFFKIDQDEALLLDLASGLLKYETSSPGTIASTIPSPSNLIYRLFSENVSQDYFCEAIPALEPAVVQENTATTGDVAIDTKVSAATKDNKTYSHAISITDLTLTNDLGERLTDSSTLFFGDFKTSTANSAKLAIPFSNYEAIAAYSECESAPSQGSIRLYKLINDEFVSLDVPLASLVNAATEESAGRKVNLENGIFKYVVLDTLVASEMVCTTSALPEEIESWNYVSTSGDLSIDTVENAPDSEGRISFTHSFTLEKIILTLQGDEGVEDVPLEEIETVSMGSYTTFAN